MAKRKTKKDKANAIHEWQLRAKQLQQFLGVDPEITVVIDEAVKSPNKSVDIITGNPIKANALFDLLVNKPLAWEDGATLTFKVNGTAKSYETTCEVKDYERAFRNNPYFSHVEQDRKDAYVMWNPIPVQVAANNVQDPNGFEHVMPVDFAKIVFQPEFAHGTQPLIAGGFSVGG